MGYDQDGDEGWLAITESPPFETEVLLWLKADYGEIDPIGNVIGIFKTTAMGDRWIEKTTSQSLNTGLRQDLITHYKLLDDGPPEEEVRDEAP